MSTSGSEEDGGTSEAGTTGRVAAPNAPSQRAWPHLIVVSGPEVGRMFRISRRETKVGRSAAADVCLPVESVSRNHAVIRLTDDRMTIEDLGSKNGTFVGVERIKKPCEVHDGDEVTLGTTVLVKLTYSPAIEGIFDRIAFETASRDAATRISNTNYLADRLRSEHAFARRHQQSLSIVFARLDGAANLRTTGAVGRVMRAVATVIRESIRTEDVLAAIAEDELVALIRADVVGAQALVSRIRERLRRECTLPEGEGRPVTIASVIMPLESSIMRSPETIVMAGRERARLAMGEQSDCVVVLPTPESDRAPPRRPR